MFSGLAAYFLAFVLTRCHAASFVAGIAFAFAPYRLSHTQHLQLLSSYWMPVATYTGGIEHAILHLIYTRFFHKACRDLGLTQGDEPMLQLRNQGIILGEDSEKMSKSRGNVVAPDALVGKYGADTVRAYLMFFARWEQGAPWSSAGIEGTARWLRRVWSLLLEPRPRRGGTIPPRRNSFLFQRLAF